MIDRLIQYFKNGFIYVREHSQLTYTLFLIIVIPVAFIVSGQQFLQSASSGQERLEQERIGLLQDVFSEFATYHLNDSGFLRARIKGIAGLNDDITRLLIVVPQGDTYRIVASLNPKENDMEISDPTDVQALRWARVGETSIFAPVFGGVRHWVAVRAIPDTQGRESAILLTDISMKRLDTLMEREVRTSYLYLAGIIIGILLLLIRQARVIDYAVLYQKLKSVDQMKDDFISMAAHELRTPLTIIRGYVSMLEEKISIQTDDKKLVARINASIEQLHLLISDILDVSRLQQGRLAFDMKEVQPHVVLEDVVESLVPVAQQKGIILSFSAPVPKAIIKVDEGRFKQVLINIIGNAVKYTKEGSVMVRAYVEGNRLYVRVSDTGIGMTEEEREHLFERFYRVKNRDTKEIRGTGLGLWISKKIIEQMHGSISVESIKGKGTDFIISFPEQKPH